MELLDLTPYKEELQKIVELMTCEDKDAVTLGLTMLTTSEFYKVTQDMHIAVFKDIDDTRHYEETPVKVQDIIHCFHETPNNLGIFFGALLNQTYTVVLVN